MTVDAFDPQAFRTLTSRVVAAERIGFWGDWTDEQRRLYCTGDWRGFSLSRGYTEAEVADYAAWLDVVTAAAAAGHDPFDCVRDILLMAALRSVQSDTRGELLLSSHGPFGPWDQPADPDTIEAGMATLYSCEACGTRVHRLAGQALTAFRGWRVRFER